MVKILVTGTSSGIGLQVVRQLLSLKAEVIGVARRDAPIGDQSYTHVKGDLCDPETLRKVAEACGDRLDGAVVNAGVLSPVARVSDADINAWKKLFDVNFFSVVALTKLVLPALRKARGRIILVSSGASEHAYQSWGAYGASKAALNHFALTLAAEEPDIIPVSLAPGVVDTDMQTDIRTNHAANMTPEESAKFKSLHAEGKLNSAEAVATVYAKLAIKADPALCGKYLRYGDACLASYN